MGHDEIDRLMGSLRQPSTVQRRLEILDHLITYWHGAPDRGLRRADSELRGLQLPRPLRWLYERGIDRAPILSRQNTLLGPEEPLFDDDHLLFYVENQGVYLWAIARESGRRDAPDQLRLPFEDVEIIRGAVGREDDDPPVWGRFNEKNRPWAREEVRLSEFLIQACLFEAIITASHGVWASWGDRALLERVTEGLRPLPLGAWR
jgi:hypothetical protein